MARSRFQKQIAQEKKGLAGDAPAKHKKKSDTAGGRGDAVAMAMIPIIEISTYCPKQADVPHSKSTCQKTTWRRYGRGSLN